MKRYNVIVFCKAPHQTTISTEYQILADTLTEAEERAENENPDRIVAVEEA